jgi:hypothetical protein
MKTIIGYERSNVQILFKEIEDRECFYSGGTLYMKILLQDLDAYGINHTDPIKGVNAISMINAGLTLFTWDEKVFKSTKNYEEIR